MGFTIPQADSEKTILQRKSIFISNKRVVIGATTYSMANITSVKIIKESPSTLPGVLIALFGAIFGCYMAIMIGSDGFLFGLVVPLVIIVGGVILGIVVTAKTKSNYILRISSASGEVDAFTSKDQTQIRQIATAINQAMTEQK
jgi:hypothetical protein